MFFVQIISLNINLFRDMYLIFLNLNYSIYIKKIKRIFHYKNLLILRIKNIEELIIFYFDNHE